VSFAELGPGTPLPSSWLLPFRIPDAIILDSYANSLYSASMGLFLQGVAVTYNVLSYSISAYRFCTGGFGFDWKVL